MSPVKDNVGRGLNIALVNGEPLVRPDSPGVGGVSPFSRHRAASGGAAGQALPVCRPLQDVLLLEG